MSNYVNQHWHVKNKYLQKMFRKYLVKIYEKMCSIINVSKLEIFSIGVPVSRFNEGYVDAIEGGGCREAR